MWKMRKKSIFWIIFPALVLISTMSFLSCMSERPENLGLKDGRLSNCPDKPNCVCSFQSDDKHFIEPLSYKNNDTEVHEKIVRALKELPRTKIITETETYIHAECTSLIFRFTDDLEIYIDNGQKLVHFRSASRVGHSDLGVNRKRVEQIKSALNDL